MSLMRASAVVKRQSTVVAAVLRRSSQAATSAASVCRSAMRWSKHWRPSTLSSISAMLSQLPCLGVAWISKMLGKGEVIQLMSHAAVFVCPSTYEPLGIVNLEAMACRAPVVATATGGIPEVVEDGRTGFLVPFETTDPRGTPVDAKASVAAIIGGSRARDRAASSASLSLSG